MFKLTNTYNKFSDEETNSLLAFSNICNGVQILKYYNGDSMAEIIRFESDLINGKFVYIPRYLPCPSWLRFDFDYICYMVEDNSGDGAPAKSVSKKQKVDKHDIKIFPVCCGHTLCKKRRSNNSGVSYNFLLQLHQSSLIRQFLCKLYEMASNEKYHQDFPLVSRCNDIFEALIKKYSSDYIVDYFLPLLHAKRIYNGFILSEDGFIRWNPNFPNLIFLANRVTQYELIFKNPYPTREFSFYSIDNIRCNVIFSANKATITTDEPCHVDPKDLVFRLEDSVCSIVWDFNAIILHLDVFKVVNFKNISYPKRNWTENICYAFFSLYGCVPYNTESKEMYAISSLKTNLPLVYNCGSTLEESILSWKEYLNEEEIAKVREEYHNDRVFTVLSSVDPNLHKEMLLNFVKFTNLIVSDLAALHPATYEGSISYSFPMNAIERKHDFIDKRLVSKRENLVSNFMVPIFLKPSGLTFNGFCSFVSTYKNHSFMFENSYIKQFEELVYTPEVIEHFYPNCKSRPYGQEWWTYLTSGKSAYILFDCEQAMIKYMRKYSCSETVAKECLVRLWRDICVTARISSGLLWTRNICHCPDSLQELEKNLSFISKFYNKN